jgi:hypothetical protein
MEINKGPDWRSAQWVAAAAGFVVSAAISYVLVSHYGVDRRWAVVVIAAGLCVPPFVVGKKR